MKNPDNYRGITINSCLSKLFNLVLNNRLLCLINKKDILKNKQIGFCKVFRTADHVLTTKALMRKYLSESRYCYFIVISALWTSRKHMIVYGVKHYLKSY